VAPDGRRKRVIVKEGRNFCTCCRGTGGCGLRRLNLYAGPCFCQGKKGRYGRKGSWDRDPADVQTLRREELSEKGEDASS